MLRLLAHFVEQMFDMVEYIERLYFKLTTSIIKKSMQKA